MGRIADIEAEVVLVESYLKEDIEHIFELQVLRDFYNSIRAILDFDSLGESAKE